MSNQQFEEEFYKLINPVDTWQGAGSSIKEIFLAKLELYGITSNQAEKLLGMEKRTLEGILDKSAKRVDVINLLKLGQFLGLNTEALFKIYISEIPSKMVGELEDTRKKSYLLSNFDIKNLHKAGLLKSKTDYNLIEKNIIDYFGFETIFDYSDRTAYIPAFSKTKRSESSLMREFWTKSAFMLFEKINNPNDYDRDRLVDLVSKIKPYTMNVENGLKIVSQALYSCGVTVIYQQHLPTTQVRGATFIVNNKPCIALTDLNKNYATLWFALLHELHHVLFDFDEIKKQTFHLTGETDLFLLQEDKANDFSREYLFSYENSKYIYPHIDNSFVVKEFAKKCQIHPSLIYNFYCYDKQKSGKGNYWAKYKFQMIGPEAALKDFNLNSFKGKSIEESIDQIKATIFNF